MGDFPFLGLDGDSLLPGKLAARSFAVVMRLESPPPYVAALPAIGGSGDRPAADSCHAGFVFRASSTGGELRKPKFRDFGVEDAIVMWTDQLLRILLPRGIRVSSRPTAEYSTAVPLAEAK
jgi:hypothetical protein